MRTKSSIYNFIMRLISSIIPSLLGIVLNNLIITTYGSDVNGVTVTINQVVNLLTIFEGGFSLATNVALYKPYINNDIHKINGILSATRKIFVRLGYVITFLAIIISFITPYIIKSEVDRNLISVLFIIISLNLSFQFLITAKYNIMFAVGQKEYIYTATSLLINMFSQGLSIISILYGADIIFIKLIALLIPLLRMPLVVKLFHKNFPGINFKSEKPDYSIIESTKDIMVQKFAGLIFGSTDSIIISAIINSKSASVYSVYNMIFAFIKSILFSLILAPFNAFGQLNAEGDKNELSYYYKIYQFISITFITIFVTTTCIVTLPFIELYTKNVTDIDYANSNYAILFSICCVLELLSNMCASLSNSSGDFVPMKKITLLSAIINIITSLLLVKPFGINGVLVGTIIAYIVMDSYQLYLVHIKTLNSGLKFIIKLILLNSALSFVLIKLSMNFNINFKNYIDFIIVGAVTISIVAITVLTFNIIINFKLAKDSISKVRKVFIRSY